VGRLRIGYHRVMQSALILGLMVLSTAAKLASILRIAISHLAWKYPLFTLMTAFSAARTLALVIAIESVDKYRLYPQIWERTEGLTLALQAAAAIEAFWILALHFRNIRAFGSILLSVIAAVGAVLAYSVVAGWSGKWSSPLTSTAIVMQRVGLVLILIALLSRLFFRQFPTVPVKPNAIRHLGILTLLYGGFVLSGFVGAGWNFASNVAVTLGGFVAYSWWTISMTPEGEKLPFSPSPPLSEDDFETADATDRKKMIQVVQSARATQDRPR
jgi:hypothetical protein